MVPVKEGEPMRFVLQLVAAAGCVLIALLFGKSAGSDWASVLMSVFFGGTAGALLATAGG